jgi:hypothetical protein
MRLSPVNERKALRRQTADLLAGLGGSSTEVASSLAGYRVHGRPRDPHGCAVAVYLHAVLGADPRVKTVKVSQASVRVTLAGRRRWVEVLSPPAVQAFIETFDQGLFPSLVQPAVDGALRDEPAAREADAAVPASA